MNLVKDRLQKYKLLDSICRPLNRGMMDDIFEGLDEAESADLENAIAYYHNQHKEDDTDGEENYRLQIMAMEG